MNPIIQELAKIEYDLFVVNNSAVAIQSTDGLYYKKNIPVSPLIIQKMIENKGSMGCYQQVYGTDRLRWVCFDFDCNDKDNPNLSQLYDECIMPLTNYLDSKGIAYLTEFSGRRGIHVWIIFQRITTKTKAYHLMDAIINEISDLKGIESRLSWSLDRFPKTDSAKNNIVGSQVKFPLSVHQNGGRSYFFRGHFLDKYDVESDDFYIEQIGILKEYQEQDADRLCEDLGVKDIDKSPIYTIYNSLEYEKETLDTIISTLDQIQAYHNIFERMKRGRSVQYDWLVLLGTFAPFDSTGNMTKTLLQRYPNYDLQKTTENIKKLHDKYFPAKLSYIYSLYNLTIEDGLDPNDTAVDYLCNRLDIKAVVQKWESYKKQEYKYSKLEKVLIKERNYVWDNDEVVSASMYNKLDDMRQYELKQYEIIMDRFAQIIPNYEKYVRNEGDKERLLISLSPRDRLITTAFALDLYSKLGYRWKSYSYQVSEMRNDFIFYQWYSSWSRYIAQLRVYTDLSFMQDAYVFYIDLKQCYEHIDLLNVYRYFERILTPDASKIFKYLQDYNDSLMRKIQNGNRLGVPQGPAYARIIAEIYLDAIIKSIENKYTSEDSGYQIFRYVDDIVVVSESEEIAEGLFNAFKKGFKDNNLPINIDKSRYYGLISEMTDEEKLDLLHADCFNYELSLGDDDVFLVDADVSERLNRYISKHDFDINLLGFLFGRRTFSRAHDYYFYRYGKEIMSSVIGRGKSFRYFYGYVLSDSSRIEYALQHGWMKQIPIYTINYSNFIATLYHMIRNGEIAEDDITKIVLGYLIDIDRRNDQGKNLEFEMSYEDRITTNAIINWVKARSLDWEF